MNQMSKYSLRIITKLSKSRSTGIHCPPPHLSSTIYYNPHFSHCFKLSAIAVILISLYSSAVNAKSFIDQTGKNDKNILTLNDGKVHTYESVEIFAKPNIDWNQHTFLVDNGSSVTVTNSANLRLEATHYIDTNDTGNYALTVRGGSQLNLDCDVDIHVEQKPDDPDVVVTSIGANGIWTSDKSTVTIGNENSSTRIWTFAATPDTLSAKNFSTINIKSTKNQIVGNIDLGISIHLDFGNIHIHQDPGSISATFAGSDSFWVGDQKTDYGTFDLTFEDQAQWVYMRDKSITAITLQNGGIVNLYDQDVQNFYKTTGLDQYFTDNILKVDHNYVTIEDLKGNGGVFKMDLNANVGQKDKSDVVFIENSSKPGQHSIDLVAHDLSLLESISPKNTLVFALTDNNAAGENGVTFVDKVNEYGEGLVDYELQINHSEMTEEDRSREELQGKIWSTSSYVGGTKWFIERITLRDSAASLGMSGAGYASYGAAVEMDRRSRRLHETVRSSEDSQNGLWLRVHNGRSGIENQYRWERSGVTIGFNLALADNNRAGVWFGYTEGDTKFLNVQGNGDMERYELALYDTLTLENHYLDFVGRIGRISNKFSVGNESYSTSADYDQDFASVSAEYGYSLRSPTGVFFEPQLQLQITYLDSFDYSTSRDMSVNAESETSTIGRAGIRTGKTFYGPDHTGEIYFYGDVFHQFTNGQNAELSDGTHQLYENWGDIDSWADIGVGTAWNWKNRFILQLDAEKTTGGKTEDSWMLLGRFNYLF